MIPKIIHYCWLSGDKKPESIQKCLKTWKKHLPDYEICLWDMSSFDYDSVPFTRDALKNRKWAFVSDYIRLYALNEYGGIYLDSDVQVLGKLDELLDNKMFTGIETRDKEHTQLFIEAAIMGAEKGHPFIKKSLEVYNNRQFIKEDGSMDQTPIPTILTDIMEEMYGWKRVDEIQHLNDGVTVYPTSVIANSNCDRTKTVKLYHLNNRSWMPTTRLAKFLRGVKRICRNWL